MDNADIERFFVEDGYLNEDELVERPPVVNPSWDTLTMVKTTLWIPFVTPRVATGEAGGITQHIGAYQIVENGKKITFLDTPGHAAFTSIVRVVLLLPILLSWSSVADDGVMPQTIGKATNLLKAANVRIIVVINKIDKPGAKPKRYSVNWQSMVLYQLLGVEILNLLKSQLNSTKTLKNCWKQVLLVAEIQELKADPNVRAIGAIIETRLDKGKRCGRNPSVQQGTLNVQDPNRCRKYLRACPVL